MRRREFIKLSLVCSSLLLIPTTSIANNKKNKILVLIELDGGNDGLNTVIPFNEPNYYNLRPTLAIKKEDTHIINEDFGLHKNLNHIAKLYKDGNCAIVHGLGYDNPNLSHFRSIQIVETASDFNEYINSGWISHTLERFNLNDTRPAHAILLGKRKKGYLFSNKLDVLQVKNIEKYIKNSTSIRSDTENSSNKMVTFLQNQISNIERANNSFAKYVKNINIKTNFGQSDIEQDFKELTKLIKSDINIPVIKVSQKGYDTHANQKERQEELLLNLDNALHSFVKELKLNYLFDNVLIATYSEFGRRVKENGSEGTDHGTASVHFVIGGNVKGGMYGKAPNLNNLHKNNLLYTTHYRSYYNTILSNWFGNTNNQFQTYKDLGFIKK